jgi:hypothetical protein
MKTFTVSASGKVAMQEVSTVDWNARNGFCATADIQHKCKTTTHTFNIICRKAILVIFVLINYFPGQIHCFASLPISLY